MYTYEATIVLNGKQFNVTVKANNDHDAKVLVNAQYSGCQIRNMRCLGK